MPKEPTIMSFEEWKERNPEIVVQEEEKEQDCEECDGTGKHTVVKNSAFLMYENERNKNIQAWKAWACA